MKTIAAIGFLVLAVGALPAAAFDGERPGFTLALQAGVGQAEYTQKDADGDHTYDGDAMAIVWRLGYAPAESWWFYAVNRAHFFEGEGPDDRVQGLGGLGAAWSLAGRGLPLYVAAEAGMAVHQNRITSVNENGFGYAFGVGWELRRHFALEFSYLKGSTSKDGWPDKDLQNLALTIGWIGY